MINPTNLVLGALLILLTPLTRAVFQDEAGVLDNHHALLGIPEARNTFFHRPNVQAKGTLLYTLSIDGLVGAVNPKSGVTLWRHQLAQNAKRGQPTAGFLVTSESANVVVSGWADRIQAWDGASGRLAWSRRIRGSIQDIKVVPNSNGTDTIAVIACQEGLESPRATIPISLIDLERGYETQSFSGASDTQSLAIIPGSKNTLYFLSGTNVVAGSRKVQISRIDLRQKLSPDDKEVDDMPIATEDLQLDSRDSILFADLLDDAPMLIWHDTRRQKISIRCLHKSTSIELPNLPALSGKITNIKVQGVASKGSSLHSVLLLTYNSGEDQYATAYSFDSAVCSIEKSLNIPFDSVSAGFSLHSVVEDILIVQSSQDKLSVFSAKEARLMKMWQVSANDGPFDRVVSTSAELLVKADGDIAIRAAITLASGDWILIRNGEVIWRRPESLCQIVDAVFVDEAVNNPVIKAVEMEKQAPPLTAYFMRWRRHLSELSTIPGWLWKHRLGLIESAQAVAEGASISDIVSASAFDRFVVVATATGRIAKLHTNNHNRVIWNEQIRAGGIGYTMNVSKMQVEDAIIHIRLADGSEIRMDLHHGRILSDNASAFEGGKALRVAQVMDVNGTKHDILINDDGSLHAAPLVEVSTNTIVVARDQANGLSGWLLSATGQAPSLAWRFEPPTGRILEINHRPLEDTVVSIGKVLGDRNVLYKYLNPFLTLVTTVDESTSSLVLYLLDSLSGTLLHSIRHEHVDLSQPIAAVVSEHTFIYTLTKHDVAHDSSNRERSPISGPQLIVCELFESSRPNERIRMAPFLNTSQSQISHDAGPSERDTDSLSALPHLESRAFILPGPVAHLAMTSTLQGITPHSLLCHLVDGRSLLAIPSFILQARRPIGRDPTPAEMEEGLVRYSALLPFEPKWLLSYGQDLQTVSQILTAPTRYESTSMIFAYGSHDIFSTRISPIGSFDMLGPSFNKTQVVVIVVALMAVTFGLYPFVKRKREAMKMAKDDET